MSRYIFKMMSSVYTVSWQIIYLSFTALSPTEALSRKAMFLLENTEYVLI